MEQWENLPTAPPSFRQKIRSRVRAFGSLLLDRKLSSCGTNSPPLLGCKSLWKATREKLFEFGCGKSWMTVAGRHINGQT